MKRYMSTETKEAVSESNRRRANCSKCGGTCELLSGLNDMGHFPNIVYKRCTACGWETAPLKGESVTLIGLEPTYQK